MKKTHNLALFLVLSILLMFTGCGKNTGESSVSESNNSSYELEDERSVENTTAVTTTESQEDIQLLNDELNNEEENAPNVFKGTIDGKSVTGYLYKTFDFCGSFVLFDSNGEACGEIRIGYVNTPDPLASVGYDRKKVPGDPQFEEHYMNPDLYDENIIFSKAECSEENGVFSGNLNTVLIPDIITSSTDSVNIEGTFNYRMNSVHPMAKEYHLSEVNHDPKEQHRIIPSDGTPTYCGDLESESSIEDDKDNGVTAVEIDSDLNIFRGKINGESVIAYLDDTYEFYLEGDRDFNACFVIFDDDVTACRAIVMSFEKDSPPGTYTSGYKASAEYENKINPKNLKWTDYYDTKNTDGWTIELSEAEYAKGGVFSGSVKGTLKPGMFNRSPSADSFDIEGTFNFQMDSIHPAAVQYRSEHSDYDEVHKSDYYQSIGSMPSSSGGGSSSSNNGVKDCSSCGGSGRCSSCNGDGWKLKDGKKVDCVSCNGSGTCKICYGKGGSGGKSNNTDSKTCRTCKGSGECTRCAGRGEKINSFNGKMNDCTSCRGTGRCSVCNGDGRI